MTHMGSDHRCVMAKFEIPVKTKRKTLPNKATSGKIGGNAIKEDLADQTCEDGFEARYKDLEQEVKDAEPVKKKKTAAKRTAAAEVAAAAVGTARAKKKEQKRRKQQQHR